MTRRGRCGESERTKKDEETACIYVGKALFLHEKALFCKLNSMLNCMESIDRPEEVY
jgi:hypothetical protein